MQYGKVHHPGGGSWLSTIIVAVLVIGVIMINNAIVNISTGGGGLLSTKIFSTAKLDAYLEIMAATREVRQIDLHWDQQIVRLRNIAQNWKELGFSAQEIIFLFAQLGEMKQEVSCRGKTSDCYDGASSTHKATGWLEVELEKAQEIRAKRGGNQAQPIYCETGFNYGKSSMAALLAGFRVYSFDVQQHAYSDGAARIVDTIWPGLFTMTKGSSFDTLPKLAAENPDIKCDIISIDGMHTYDGVVNDFKNFQKMAAPRALVLIDDIGPKYIGGDLHKAWQELTFGASAPMKIKRFVHYGDVMTVRGPRDNAWGVAEMKE